MQALTRQLATCGLLLCAWGRTDGSIGRSAAAKLVLALQLPAPSGEAYRFPLKAKGRGSLFSRWLARGTQLGKPSLSRTAAARGFSPFSPARCARRPPWSVV